MIKKNNKKYLSNSIVLDVARLWDGEEMVYRPFQ